MSTRPAFVGGPTGPGLAAPGPGGYVVAVLVADLVFSCLLVADLLVATAGDAVAGASWLLLLVPAYVVPTSLPLALVGVPVAHLVCRRLSDQRLHVLLAGAVGLLAAVAVDALLLGGQAWWPLAALPVATAAGRAALVPAVRRERASRAAAVDFAPWSPLR